MRGEGGRRRGGPQWRLGEAGKRKAGSRMRYLLASYSLNGTYLGLTDLASQLQLCESGAEDPSAWLNVGNDFRVSCNVPLASLLARTDVAPLVIASFDIECVPKKGTKFPRSECTDDQLAQIGVSFGVLGRGVVHRSVICLGETGPVTLQETGEPVEILSCATERDVLQTFADMMLMASPDIVTG